MALPGFFSHKGTKGTKFFFGGGWPQIASRGSRVSLPYCDHPVVTMVRVKALLGFFTAQRSVGRGVSNRPAHVFYRRLSFGGPRRPAVLCLTPNPVVRLAEHREGRASLVRGQADACPSLRFANPMARVGFKLPVPWLSGTADPSGTAGSGGAVGGAPGAHGVARCAFEEFAQGVRIREAAKIRDRLQLNVRVFE